MGAGGGSWRGAGRRGAVLGVGDSGEDDGADGAHFAAGDGAGLDGSTISWTESGSGDELVLCFLDEAACAAFSFTFRHIIQAKSVGERTCYPYLATMLNCLCWVAYGAPEKNLPVVIINGVGFLVEGVYCALYIAYSGGKRRLIAIILFVLEFILAAIFAAFLLTLLRGSDKADVRQMIFGVFASASGVVMYASPIMDLVSVVKTKDKSNMSLALALFSFGNGVVWTVYAFFKPLNWYIMVPNALGIICASAQIVVYVLASFHMFCFKAAQ